MRNYVVLVFQIPEWTLLKYLNKNKTFFCKIKLLTIQNFYENSSLQWKKLIFGNKCNKSQQMRLHGYLGSCDQGLKNVLSIAYRHNLNSLNCHNQSCLSWSFLHIDKMTKTCSERENKKVIYTYNYSSFRQKKSTRFGHFGGFVLDFPIFIYW